MNSGLGVLLLLADGRFPSGGHAHSGGLEPAVSAGSVRDPAGLAAFLRGRLATAGLVAAAFAAAAARADTARPDAARADTARPDVDLDALDDGLDVRTPSPAQRRASRTQGRALLRAGRAIWPLPPWRADPHQPVALGRLAAAGGVRPEHAALAAAHGSVAGPASAAVRLLGLDPYAVHAVLARLSGECEAVAARAAGYSSAAAWSVDELPAAAAPLLDVTAEVHAAWEVRLFAS
jgi:urease accessory protein